MRESSKRQGNDHPDRGAENLACVVGRSRAFAGGGGGRSDANSLGNGVAHGSVAGPLRIVVNRGSAKFQRLMFRRRGQGWDILGKLKGR